MFFLLHEIYKTLFEDIFFKDSNSVSFLEREIPDTV